MYDVEFSRRSHFYSIGLVVFDLIWFIPSTLAEPVVKRRLRSIDREAVFAFAFRKEDS